MQLGDFHDPAMPDDQYQLHDEGEEAAVRASLREWFSSFRVTSADFEFGDDRFGPLSRL